MKKNFIFSVVAVNDWRAPSDRVASRDQQGSINLEKYPDILGKHPNFLRLLICVPSLGLRCLAHL